MVKRFYIGEVCVLRQKDDKREIFSLVILKLLDIDNNKIIEDGLEDIRRRRLDNNINNSYCHVYDR